MADGGEFVASTAAAPLSAADYDLARPAAPLSAPAAAAVSDGGLPERLSHVDSRPRAHTTLPQLKARLHDVELRASLRHIPFTEPLDPEARRGRALAGGGRCCGAAICRRSQRRPTAHRRRRRASRLGRRCRS